MNLLAENIEMVSVRAVGSGSVMNAKEIVLDYEDYFTILLTGISGIFVNNLPLSS